MECYACGCLIPLDMHRTAVAMLHRYSAAVLDVETHYLVDGDTVTPKNV
jgi:hypothetical protein